MKPITHRGSGSKNTEAQKSYDEKRGRVSAVKNYRDKHKTKVTLPKLNFMKEEKL